jgi:hypothetical protein
MRSRGFLAEYPAMESPEFAERLSNHHPNINNVPLPERGDFLLTERVHAGIASLLPAEIRARHQRVIDVPGLLELPIGERLAPRVSFLAPLRMPASPESVR